MKKTFRFLILKKKDALLFREVRLKALQDSPDSFGGTYEEESEKPISYWEELVNKKPDKSVIFAAEYDKKLIGTLFCFCREKDICGFGGIWVDPFHRKKGVASALVKKGIAWAKKNSLEKITLWNTEINEAAKNMYKKFGFEPTGNKRLLESNKNFTIQEWVKIL